MPVKTGIQVGAESGAGTSSLDSRPTLSRGQAPRGNDERRKIDFRPTDSRFLGLKTAAKQLVVGIHYCILTDTTLETPGSAMVMP
jgi:hypothetical protein